MIRFSKLFINKSDWKDGEVELENKTLQSNKKCLAITPNILKFYSFISDEAGFLVLYIIRPISENFTDCRVFGTEACLVVLPVGVSISSWLEVAINKVC